MPWHPPCRNTSQRLPGRLERHREGRALQAPSHMQPSRSRLGAHSPSKHRADMCLLTGAGKQRLSNSRLSPSRETKTQTGGKKKIPMVLFEPKSPASSPSLAARAGGGRDGYPGWGPLCCKGGWPAPCQHLQRGPRARPMHRARTLEALVSAQPCHTQPQVCKGKSPLVLHLKTKNLQK